MTNNQTPIDRIDSLIAALTHIRSTALDVEGDNRLDDPLADNIDAMSDAFCITEDDIIDGDLAITHDTLAIIRKLILP